MLLLLGALQLQKSRLLCKSKAVVGQFHRCSTRIGCLRSPLWQFPEESAQCQRPIFLGHSDILSTALTADDLMISRALLIARLGSQEARPKTFMWSAARRPSEIRDGRRWSKRFSFGGHSGLQFIVTYSHSAQSYSMTFGVRMTRGISELFPWLIKRMSEVVRV